MELVLLLHLLDTSQRVSGHTPAVTAVSSQSTVLLTAAGSDGVIAGSPHTVSMRYFFAEGTSSSSWKQQQWGHLEADH